MALITRPADDAATMAIGAIGGALAGAVGLGVLVAGSMIAGREPIVAANAIGAWLVRWLQTADPSALDNVYADASIAGIASAILFGAAIGAPLAAWIARYPDDHPIAWGAMAGIGLWALTRWILGPALDPILVRPDAAISGWTLAAGHVAYGLFIGVWLDAAFDEPNPPHWRADSP